MMPAGWWRLTGRRQQRFDVVGVEDSEQVVKGADEPAATVGEHLDQLLDLQEAFFCALHLRKEISKETSTSTLPASAGKERYDCNCGSVAVSKDQRGNKPLNIFSVRIESEQSPDNKAEFCNKK